MRFAACFTKSAAILSSLIAGSMLGGTTGGLAGSFLTVALLAVPLKGRSLSAWVLLYLRRHRHISVPALETVANDRASAGIRCVDGAVIAAIQVLGKAHRTTRITGSGMTEARNTLDLVLLASSLNQSLGITLDSVSVVIAGSRRNSIGDYPRVYDTIIGAVPYAGRRQIWLILRIQALDNSEALRWRTTLGAVALAAAQETAALLRMSGVRAKLATANEIIEFEHHVGRDALDKRLHHWNALRADTGWLTTYTYRTAELDRDMLEEPWRWQVDGVIQNVTLFADGTASAAVAVRTGQRLTSPPSRSLVAMPGEQVDAVTLNMCLPRPRLRRIAKAAIPPKLIVPVGSSGVLIGKDSAGGRVFLPLSDPAKDSRVHIAADDRIAKRLVVRSAASGERITLHSRDVERWSGLRMPNLVVTSEARPLHGTTISVVDGTVSPAPRPRTVVSIGNPDDPAPSADVLFEQIGPARVRVHSGVSIDEIDVEMVRAENRYLLTGKARLVEDTR